MKKKKFILIYFSTSLLFLTNCGTPEVIPPAHIHEWGDPTYTWASDYSSCTATRVCLLDETHIEEYTSNSSYEVIKEATYEKEGSGKYTATFSISGFETQIKEVTIPIVVDYKVTKEEFENTLSLYKQVNSLKDNNYTYTVHQSYTMDYLGTPAYSTKLNTIKIDNGRLSEVEEAMFQEQGKEEEHWINEQILEMNDDYYDEEKDLYCFMQWHRSKDEDNPWGKWYSYEWNYRLIDFASILYASDYLSAFVPVFSYEEMIYDEDTNSYVLESKENINDGPYSIDYSNIVIKFKNKKLIYISFHSERSDSQISDVYIDGFRDYGTTVVETPDVNQ